MATSRDAILKATSFLGVFLGGGLLGQYADINSRVRNEADERFYALSSQLLTEDRFRLAQYLRDPKYEGRTFRWPSSYHLKINSEKNTPDDVFVARYSLWKTAFEKSHMEEPLSDEEQLYLDILSEFHCWLDEVETVYTSTGASDGTLRALDGDLKSYAEVLNFASKSQVEDYMSEPVCSLFKRYQVELPHGVDSQTSRVGM